MEKQLGKKAESLLELKKRGLFKQHLLIIPNVVARDEFFRLMNSAGFIEGSDIAVRFSSASKSIHLPRSIILDSFDKAYEFFSKNLSNELVSVIHEFVTPIFSGTLIKKDGVIYLNVLNGAWETETSKHCDNIIISGNKAKILFSPGEKNCLFVNRDKLEKKSVRNTQEKIVSLVKMINSKVISLKLDENILYEFCITPKDDFSIIEYRKEDGFNHFEFESGMPNLFEVSEFSDFERWDKKKELVLSVPVTRESDLEFTKLINKIKPYTNRVYIKYGVCSHPAILLREDGIETIPFNEEKEIIEVDLTE